ncbi:MAG: peptidylprolyl isomerase [Clostridia bacterium]|nr:peptidylprolyl isomerase [Clostridia bacterium]
MKKFLALIMATILLVTLFSACGKSKTDSTNPTEPEAQSSVKYANLEEGVAALAGEHKITMDDVAVYVDMLVPYIQQKTGANPGWEDILTDSGLTARDELVMAAIEECRYQYAFINFAKENGYFTDEQAEQFFSEYVISMGGEAVLDELITEYNFNRDSLKQFIVFNGAFNALTEALCSDEEAEKLYNEKYYVTAKHILVLFEGRENEEAALKEAEAIYNKAISGESFEALITEYNEDPGQNVETGYTFTDGEMVPEFYNGTMALKVGDISAPVKTTYGYHIIKRYANPGSEDANYANYIANVKSMNARDFLNETKQNEIISAYPLTINEGIAGKVDLSRYTVEQVLDENVNYADGSIFNE